MPFGLIAALGVGIFAIALNEKKKTDVSYRTDPDVQRQVKIQADGSYRDTYGNNYQRLSDGTLIAVPAVRH